MISDRDPASLDKYQTYFCDSITALSRLCFNWAKSQPAAFSDRTSKPDSRGAYGLLGQEMVTALTHLQHARGKNVVFVAILDSKTDARCLCRRSRAVPPHCNSRASWTRWLSKHLGYG